MQITIELSNIQHIVKTSLNINLAENRITCIVGKNGVGKTTLIKALRNLSLSETFKQTSADYIFNEHSFINYKIGDATYTFTYDESIRSLNCDKVIPTETKSIIDVELPLPHGQRFLFFPTISAIDLDLRKAIILANYSTPIDLIKFLNEIYECNKFDALRSIKIKGIDYYCLVRPNNRYIREDHLSSGEHLLISLYRKIQKHCKLIVIDEIDISLDAAAQARLIAKLRDWCKAFEVNILFTTHSLAMMQTLHDDELNYMFTDSEAVNIVPASYNYIKTLMFGLKDRDKYIITEDRTLKNFLTFIIERYCPLNFFSYHIIDTGTAPSVVAILAKNREQGFFSDPKDVIAVLDGDQAHLNTGQSDDTYCIPVLSVEKEIWRIHQEGGIHNDYTPNYPDISDHKRVFKELIQRGLMTDRDMFERICVIHDKEMISFAEIINKFLSPEFYRLHQLKISSPNNS